MILEMTNIEKSFGELNVLKDISLTVDKGEVVSVIGPSGSGRVLFRSSVDLSAPPGPASPRCCAPSTSWSK